MRIFPARSYLVKHSVLAGQMISLSNVLFHVKHLIRSGNLFTAACQTFFSLCVARVPSMIRHVYFKNDYEPSPVISIMLCHVNNAIMPYLE